MRAVIAILFAAVFVAACEPPTRAPSGAPAPVITKSRDDLAKEAFELSGRRQFFDETLRSGFQEFQRTPRLQAVLNDEVKVSVDQLAAEAVKVYATEFTAAELTDMIAFFNTAGGRAFLAKQSMIGEALQPVAKTVSLDLGRRIAQRVQREGLLSGSPG